jgi:hypothetical protein
MGGKGSGGRNRIGAEPMTAAQRKRRSRLGLSRKRGRKVVSLEAFEAALEAAILYRRPVPPEWFRGKEPLEVKLGRETVYAVTVRRPSD